jgi:hypothetical protein
MNKSCLLVFPPGCRESEGGLKTEIKVPVGFVVNKTAGTKLHRLLKYSCSIGLRTILYFWKNPWLPYAGRNCISIWHFLLLP